MKNAFTAAMAHVPGTGLVVMAGGSTFIHGFWDVSNGVYLFNPDDPHGIDHHQLWRDHDSWFFTLRKMILIPYNF